MKRMLFYIGVLKVAMALCSCHSTDAVKTAERANDTRLDNSLQYDASFAVTTTDNNLLQIKLGALAQSYASQEVVKKLGKTLMDHYATGNDTLQQIIKANHITVSDSLSNEASNDYRTLMKMNGKIFDSGYLLLERRLHQQSIQAYRNEILKGQNDSLKTWANGRLPLLQQYLQHISQLTDQLTQDK